VAQIQNIDTMTENPEVPETKHQRVQLPKIV